jgi:reverse transcriptase-like protein
MKQFEEFFSEDKIIYYLCKVRAKIAKQRNKKHLLHLLTDNEDFNYHDTSKSIQSEHEKEFHELLNSLFPPRSKWVKLGKPSRNKTTDGVIQKISTIDKNIYALLKTVKYYKRKEPNEPFVKRLNDFISDIKFSILNPEYSITSPFIYPKAKDKKKLHELKGDEKNICRPIALFNLKDRLILSFTNKFLSKLFDKYFEDCSLAFRAKPMELVNHHIAIQRIQEYKAKHKTIPLWVAECDMQKFYDSVNHKTIKEQFEMLISKSKHDAPHLILENCQRIFLSYLSCYSFNTNILPLNKNDEYWELYKIAKGNFGWIEKEIEQHKFYENIDLERIGVPQGGALSGLIANIVLDITDKALLAKYNDLFYTRFCDDMIIMHPDKEICEESINLYKNTLEKCQLVPHEFLKELTEKRQKEKKYLSPISLKPFWKGKSKGPYKWDDIKNDGFPWIGFVGYEIHHNGSVRVRKSSLQKELKKQKEVIGKIKEAISKEQKVSGGTVTESAIRRLIGMSVSRVELWNYSTVVHEIVSVPYFRQHVIRTF